MQISVKDCAVTVRAPLRCPKTEIIKFLNSKAAWITAAIEKQRAAKQRENELLLSGKRLLCGNEVIVSSDAELNALYKCEFEKIVERLLIFSRKYGFNVRSVGASNAKTLWGVCTGDNAIRLNRRLVMLPPRLSDYVILHELVHTVHHNHSANFWNELTKICPDCKKRRAELKEYAWLFLTE